MNPFVCLMYHNVCPAGQLADGGPFASLSPSIRSYSVTTEQFAKQLRAIGRDRWMEPAELRAAGCASECKEAPPRVLLSFDDGWAGSIDEAGPVLADIGAKAFIFVTTGLIGHPLFASEGMLRDLPTDQFEIGAHSVTHQFLAECSDDVIRRELIDSRLRLEDIMGRTVDTMSVPNGSIDHRVKQAAHEAGYAFLFTSDAILNDNAAVTGEVGRVAVRRDTTVDAVQKWCRGELSAAGWRRRALELPKRWLGPQRYRQLRGWALGETSVDDEMSDLVARHQRAASNHHQLAHTA